MKTVHLDSGRTMGGGQWQVLRLVRGLMERDHEALLMAREDAELFQRARQEGIPARPLSVLALPWLARHSDVVHAHDAHSHTWAAMFPRAPLVVSRRVAFPLGEGQFSKRKYARADAYIAVSHHVASVLADAGIPESKITVVYDGVPLMPLSVGGTEFICPASKQPPDAPVTPSHDLERDLHFAAGLVYVSSSEGLGSGVLLGMSAGVPVIASRVGGIPEIIADGEDGLLVDNSGEAVRAAIRKLQENPALARQMGARARQKIEARFSEARMVEETLDVYRKLLAHG